MNSKLLRIMAIGLTTLFLSAQAFAWGGTEKDKDVGVKMDRGTACMCARSDSAPGMSIDRDISNTDLGSYNSRTSKDRSQRDQFEMDSPMIEH